MQPRLLSTIPKGIRLTTVVDWSNDDIPSVFYNFVVSFDPPRHSLEFKHAPTPTWQFAFNISSTEKKQLIQVEKGEYSISNSRALLVRQGNPYGQYRATSLYFQNVALNPRVIALHADKQDEKDSAALVWVSNHNPYFRIQRNHTFHLHMTFPDAFYVNQLIAQGWGFSANLRDSTSECPVKQIKADWLDTVEPDIYLHEFHPKQELDYLFKNPLDNLVKHAKELQALAKQLNIDCKVDTRHESTLLLPILAEDFSLRDSIRELPRPSLENINEQKAYYIFYRTAQQLAELAKIMAGAQLSGESLLAFQLAEGIQLSSAFSELGFCHQLGIGTLQASELANDYHTKAIAQGSLVARKNQATITLLDKMNISAELAEKQFHATFTPWVLSEFTERNPSTAIYNNAIFLFKKDGVQARELLTFIKSHANFLGQHLKKVEDSWTIKEADSYSLIMPPAIKTPLTLQRSVRQGAPVQRFYISSEDGKNLFDTATLEAASGNPAALSELARCYQFGIGTKAPNLDLAKWYYSLAAKMGSETAKANHAVMELLTDTPMKQEIATFFEIAAKKEKEEKRTFRPRTFNLARMYQLGIGKAKNEKLAVDILEESATAGDFCAQNAIGYHYDSVSKDSVKAAYWYERAVAQGSLWAQSSLAGIYARRNDSKAVELYMKLVKQGYPEAYYSLGVLYEKGHLVKQDYKEAAKYYTLYAEKGDAPSAAIQKLGELHLNGHGVTKDEKKAVTLFNDAIAKGLLTAHFHLGQCREKGQGVAKDENLAFGHFKIAADNGHPDAQLNVGLYLEEGKGGNAKNQIEAVKWYEKSAKLANAYARYKLGICLARGSGINRNLHKAIQYYKLAAKQGREDAAYQLGLLYSALGTEYFQTALDWLEKSAAAGYSAAITRLVSIYQSKEEKPSETGLKQQYKEKKIYHLREKAYLSQISAGYGVGIGDDQIQQLSDMLPYFLIIKTLKVQNRRGDASLFQLLDVLETGQKDAELKPPKNVAHLKKLTLEPDEPVPGFHAMETLMIDSPVIIRLPLADEVEDKTRTLATAINSIFETNKLRCLWHLCLTGQAMHGAEIAKLMPGLQQHKVHLTRLELPGVIFDAKGIEALKDNFKKAGDESFWSSSLATLNLSGTITDPTLAPSLLEGIAYLPRLQFANLSKCKLGDSNHVANILARQQAKIWPLKTLSINESEFETFNEEKAQFFAKALDESKGLTALYMTKCKLTDFDAQSHLARAFGRHPNLTRISIRGNEFAASHFPDLLTSTSLEVVYTDTGRVTDLLKLNPHSPLHNLCFDNQCICYSDCQCERALAAFLEHNTTLQELTVANWHINPFDSKAITEAVLKNKNKSLKNMTFVSTTEASKKAEPAWAPLVKQRMLNKEVQLRLTVHWIYVCLWINFYSANANSSLRDSIFAILPRIYALCELDNATLGSTFMFTRFFNREQERRIVPAAEKHDDTAALLAPPLSSRKRRLD